MSQNEIVTRFAPSPTGYMHIGNLRTALYSYLIAKSCNGIFILRIEDTDRKRQLEDAVQVIYDTLKMAKLQYDEGPDIGGEHGPYVQSERKKIYMEYANKLIASGHAYYCFCGNKKIGEMLEDKSSAGYDRHCRNLPKEEVDEKLSNDMPYVIRQKIPLAGNTTYRDEVFGNISVENTQLQDIVLIKSDGYPTYNFAHVIDDHLMGVTHVVRGSEYVSSTPLYVLLYDSFGWKRPQYVHLPLIMGINEDGSVSKLSKRHGAVSFQDLVKDGYLPESIINYIALLGWNPKDTNDEFFTLEELVQKFRIDAINKAPAVFDYNKLLWFNGVYIRNLSYERFRELAMPYIKQVVKKNIAVEKIVPLVQPRIEKLSQIPEIISFFEAAPEFGCEMFINKKNKVTIENTKEILPATIKLLENINDWNNEILFEHLKHFAETMAIKIGTLMWIIRIAISGTIATPGGATDILEVLGKEESLLRLKYSLDKVNTVVR